MRISAWISYGCSSVLFDLDILLDRLAAARLRLAHLRRAAAAGEDRQRHLHPRRRVRRFLEHADAGDAAVQRSEEIIIAAAQDRRHLGRAVRDRKSVVEGKSGSVRVALGGRRIVKKNNRTKIK